MQEVLFTVLLLRLHVLMGLHGLSHRPVANVGQLPTFDGCGGEPLSLWHPVLNILRQAHGVVCRDI